MNRYSIKDIPPGYFFSKTAYLDDEFVVATPEMPLTEELIDTLLAWDFRELISEGDPRESYAADTKESQAADAATVSIPIDADKLVEAEKIFRDLTAHVYDLFSAILTPKPVNYDKAANWVRNLLNPIRKNQRYLLRILKKMENTGRDYLIDHTVKSTILTLIIGFYIKLPPHRLIELGVASLFHEIGMMKLPAKIHLNSRPLSSTEQKMIYAHPILGYNMLRNIKFPLAVSIAALEHHERENGSGYPRHLTSDKISLYSKIIAVTCSYEAISSRRPHREARDEYTGMLELLKNEGKQYDDTIIRALVFSLSIYPIGLYVLLSNGKKGQVLDVNPENPRFPVVQIFGELNPDGKNKTQETSPKGLRIIRPLGRKEMGL
ncbi:MAG: HD-GYP domain-containing protein [Treponema sp.]|jgi:HD-GYP domain-containing protein (c-di-GMP phosphodiesterase class II)|nr:HD-GYP domain-containing protein [Treponema sp.]